MSVNKAADTFGIPRTTLKDKLSGRTPIDSTQGPDPFLTKDEEGQLVEWAITMAGIGYGRTKEQIKDTVRTFLNKNPRPNPFPNNRPGTDWWSAFMRRHPAISLRLPEKLGKERAVSSSPEALAKWFKDFKSFMVSQGCFDIMCEPSRIYNADEAGFPLNPKCEGRVLATLGSKDVYALSGSDKSQITVLACANAAGNTIPPMFVFPGERFRYNPLHDAVPESFLARTQNGWMDTESFFMWISNHFVNHISSLRPVLLFVDGHSTHIDLETTKFCRNNGIILYCLPPHASHIVQPLDVSFFGPLKRNWRKAVKDYQDHYPGSCVTKQVFCKVFKQGWQETVKSKTVISGFRETGLYPFNPDYVVDSKKLAPSSVFVEPKLPTSLSLPPSTPHVANATAAEDITDIIISQPTSTMTDTLATDNAIDIITSDVTDALSETTLDGDLPQTDTADFLQLPTIHHTPRPRPTEANKITVVAEIHPEPLRFHQPVSCELGVERVIPAAFKGVISYPSSSKKPKSKRVNVMPKALSSLQMEQYLQKKRDEQMEKEEKRLSMITKRQQAKQAKFAKEMEKLNKKRERDLKKTARNQRSTPDSQIDPDQDRANCSKCGRAYHPEDWHLWIGCDCGRWFHIKCTDLGVKPSDYTDDDLIKEIEQLAWYCDVCL